MEDMARLALLEGSVKDNKLFASILYQLFHRIGDIIENPYSDACRVITSEVLTRALQVEGCVEFLKYIGFVLVQNKIKFPKESINMEKLKDLTKAIEKKLLYSSGITIMTLRSIPQLNDNTQLKKLNVVTTKVAFLQNLQDKFNTMLIYEDKELLNLARSKVPDMLISEKALDRMQAHGEKRNGSIDGPDMSFELAQLLELLGWFKHDFFTWVDKPNCDTCRAPTQAVNITNKQIDNEICRVEVYKCQSCNTETLFPRYNDPRKLLDSRRGRCGEWANAFTLICRALDYDVRFVCDNADHVWCEVFDFHNNRWLHVDPCEAALDTPLMYEHGWNKDVTYVFAFSRDDLQDVTWRYSSKHNEVRSRRRLCTESELLQTIIQLRTARQQDMSEDRKSYLNGRCAMELTEFMTERQPSSYESHGRISGAESWRRDRGELGNHSHTFNLQNPGIYTIRYHPVKDVYTVERNKEQCDIVNGWSKGTFVSKNVFRKQELDWKMVYLARTEESNEGSLVWKITTDHSHSMSRLSVQGTTKLYETGNIEWSLKFDDQTPMVFKLGEKSSIVEKTFKTLEIAVKLSGGNGNVAWQHAQLFRQSMDCHTSAFEICLTLV